MVSPSYLGWTECMACQAHILLDGHLCYRRRCKTRRGRHESDGAIRIVGRRHGVEGIVVHRLGCETIILCARHLICRMFRKPSTSARHERRKKGTNRVNMTHEKLFHLGL